MLHSAPLDQCGNIDFSKKQFQLFILKKERNISGRFKSKVHDARADNPGGRSRGVKRKGAGRGRMIGGGGENRRSKMYNILESRPATDFQLFHGAHTDL